MKNTVDVTDGKPIAVLLQSISGVSAINFLVAFYDIHERTTEVLSLSAIDVEISALAPNIDKLRSDIMDFPSVMSAVISSRTKIVNSL
jgi:hypothetical protein